CVDAHVTAVGPEGNRLRLEGVFLHGVGQDESGTVLRMAEVTARGDLSMKRLRTGLSYTLQAPLVAVRLRLGGLSLQGRAMDWAGRPCRVLQWTGPRRWSAGRLSRRG